MKKEYAPRSIRSIFAIMAGLLMLTWSVNTAHADGGSQLSIAGNGQTMVRNAIVTAVDGLTVTAESVWGDMHITWTIHTDGSTKVYPAGGREAVLASMKIGDEISFSGMLETLERTPTIRASYLKDLSLENASAVELGTVLSVDEDASQLVLLTDIGTTTVNVGRKTLINAEEKSIGLDDIPLSSTVEVAGSLNFVTKQFAAQKISLAPGVPNTGAPSSQPGFLTRLWTWLDGSERGTMTIK